MHAADEHPIARFEAQVTVTLRRAREDDLPKLEWFGWFTPHRQIIHETFERQQRGEAIMLLAVARDFPVGQAWIDLTRKADEAVGVIWALRVLPGL